jgi:hypothetical protein
MLPPSVSNRPLSVYDLQISWFAGSFRTGPPRSGLGALQLWIHILDPMRYLRGVAGLLIAAGLLGCEAVTHLLTACDDVAALGLGVSVVDAVSNVSLVNGTTVFVQDATFADSVTVIGDSSLVFSPRIWLLPERARERMRSP